jgi:F420-dependent oxidoreductase-like protein
MKLSLRVRYTDRKAFGELVCTAESVGLHGVWISEPWGYDCSALLGWCAANTSRLTLGSHVASVFSRSPAMTAGMAASLWSLTEGRFRLGLGVSGPAVVEGWHGVPYHRPLQRTRDTVAIIRQVLGGDAVSYQGSALSVPLADSGREPLRFAMRSNAAPVPIYLAALGPANQRLTAEIADGWTPTPYSPDHHEQCAAALTDAITTTRRQVALAPVAPVAIGTDRRALHELERGWSALYLGAMGDYYAAAARAMGFADMVEAVRHHSRNGDRASARNAVTADYIDSIGLFGTPADIRQRLHRYERAGIDEVVVELRKKDLADQLADLRELGKVATG